VGGNGTVKKSTTTAAGAVGAVTIAADRTSGGSSVRPDPEFAKTESATAVDAAAAAAAARFAPRTRERAMKQVNAARNWRRAMPHHAG
jgi:hypothetical protein